MYRLLCTIEEVGANGNASGHWRRVITFPFAPFPGMLIGGGFRVARVLVCQGGLDGEGETQVEFDRGNFGPIDRGIMANHGWRWESFE